jgi:hypothetical protein
LEKALCCFGIPTCLHENIENVSICVDPAPQPMLLAPDRDHDLIHVPFVVRPRTFAADAICKMRPKAIKVYINSTLRPLFHPGNVAHEDAYD